MNNTFKLDSQSAQSNSSFWGDFGAGIKSVGASISEGLSKIFETIGLNNLSTALKNYGQELRNEVLAYKNEKPMTLVSKQHTQAANTNISNDYSYADVKNGILGVLKENKDRPISFIKETTNFMGELIDSIAKANSSIDQTKETTINLKNNNSSYKID